MGRGVGDPGGAVRVGGGWGLGGLEGQGLGGVRSGLGLGLCAAPSTSGWRAGWRLWEGEEPGGQAPWMPGVGALCRWPRPPAQTHPPLQQPHTGPQHLPTPSHPQVHAEGEAEHAAIGHDAVVTLVPAAHEPLLRRAMLDHDRDFSAFYNHLADLLEL